MPRKVDVLATKGSLLDRLRARREAIEAGQPEKAPSKFINPEDEDDLKKGYQTKEEEDEYKK